MKKEKKIKNISTHITINLLALALIIGSIVRLWNINNYPQLNADEAALGYNAYSLIETGKDEFGTIWPLVFRSFDDYKPGVYVYLTIPFVKLFGLEIWAVRMPGLIMSIVSIGLIYLVVKELFKGKKSGNIVAGITALLLAINPWHIHFSRGAWETQTAIGFVLLGWWCLMKFRENQKYLIGGIVSLVLALYTYHSMRIIVPLIGIYFIWSNWKLLMKEWKFSVSNLLFGAILLIPFGLQIISPSGISRAQGVSLWSDQGPLWRANEIRTMQGVNPDIMVKLLHNRYVYYVLAFVDNYLSHFSFDYLLLKGDEIQRSRVPEFGQLPLYWLGLLIGGIFWTIRRLGEKFNWVWFMLLISPLASSLTFQSPHAVRSIMMVIPLTIIAAWGVVALIEYLKMKFSVWGTWTAGMLGVLVMFELIRWAFNYSFLIPYWYPFATQTGMKEVVSLLEKEKGKYDEIWITDRYDQPYILYLFFAKYPPTDFQKQAKITNRDKFGFGTVRNIDNLKFRDISWEEIEAVNGKVLVAGTPEETVGKPAIKEITNESGKVMFRIVEK